jgi:sulfur transfer protein SufE
METWVSKETIEQMKTKAFLEMAQKLEELEKQLASAQSRIRELEGQVFGGTTK